MAHNEGKGYYPPNWKQISDKVKAENDWKCENCKRTKDPYEARSIDVYHLDHDRSNNESWNLACLCNYCHRVVEQFDLEYLLLVYQSPGIFGDNWPWLEPHIPGIIQAVEARTKRLRTIAFNLRGDPARTE